MGDEGKYWILANFHWEVTDRANAKPARVCVCTLYLGRYLYVCLFFVCCFLGFSRNTTLCHHAHGFLVLSEFSNYIFTTFTFTCVFFLGKQLVFPWCPNITFPVLFKTRRHHHLTCVLCMMWFRWLSKREYHICSLELSVYVGGCVWRHLKQNTWARTQDNSKVVTATNLVIYWFPIVYITSQFSFQFSGNS